MRKRKGKVKDEPGVEERRDNMRGEQKVRRWENTEQMDTKQMNSAGRTGFSLGKLAQGGVEEGRVEANRRKVRRELAR